MAEDSGDVLASWEEQEDSGLLDERLKKISLSASFTSENRPKVPPIMMQENTGRTEYTPQLRILKREPSSHSYSTCDHQSNVKVNKPVKTLEQREAEYAEARMRIFGSAEAEPAADAESNSSNAVGSENTAIPSAEKQVRVNKAEGKPANSIIRQPLGPNGSKGFKANR